jgi:hypothetical protein
MKNKLAAHFTFLICVASLFITQHRAQAQNNQKFKASVNVGGFSENFHWSIAGTAQGTDPNIYSELRWSKLRGPQTSMHLEYNFWKGFLLQADFSSASIIKGNVTDTDFGEDHRKDTLYHESFSSDKGSVLSTDMTLGYKLSLSQSFSVTPFMGYGINAQSLYILGDFGNITGELKSTYKTQWKGLTVGFNTQIPLSDKLFITPQFTYHQVHYSAKANWNLIEEFQHPVSFRHKANGYGLEPSMKINYAFNKTISIHLEEKYSYWTTGKGSDTLYRTNGDVSVTQLNKIYRNNYSVALGVAFAF